jgi:hypothetical protein
MLSFKLSFNCTRFDRLSPSPCNKNLKLNKINYDFNLLAQRNLIKNYLIWKFIFQSKFFTNEDNFSLRDWN